MGALGEGHSLHSLFDKMCSISQSAMETDAEHKVTVSERLDAAGQCLEQMCGDEDLPLDDILRQSAVGLEVVGSVAQDPYWNRRSSRDRDRALESLKTVYEALEVHRDMVQLLATEPPSTPSSRPSRGASSDLSASFDSAGCSASQRGRGDVESDSGVGDGEQEDSRCPVAALAALRRQVTADMRLSSVAGMAQAKESLTEAVVLPIRYPHLFVGARKPWHSVLLYGPPGTGKTKLALALAAEVNAELYALTPADLLSTWFGRTEQNIRDLFGQLRARGVSRRVIVFLDEVDGLCRRRTDEEPESTRRMKTELLTQLQGDAGVAAATARAPAPRQDAGQHAGHLFFIAATNCPWEIDPAFLRRFQRRIFIGLPDRDSRREIIRTVAGPELRLHDQEWQGLLDRTNGFSGSDLSDLVKSALHRPIRELTTATHWAPVPGGWSPCSSNTVGAIRRDLQFFVAELVRARSAGIQDFRDVIESARPTVCEADLRRYEEFTHQFGERG